MKYGVNGYIKASPGKGKELLNYLLEAANEMEHVVGCYCYIVGINDEEPDNVFIYEVWEDEDAHKASLEIPVFQELIMKARPIIADLVSYPTLTIHGGKGIS